jgi:diadenosine tetraphosphatase ApaH/serine/threonine PP2A family protein phosphatase
MKYVIISDIHGNLPAFEAAQKTFPKGKSTEIICAGDVVGYGAEPVECIKKISAMGARNVLGNHDAGVLDKTDISRFNRRAAEAVLWTKEHLDRASLDFLRSLPYVLEEDLFSVAHGTLHEPKEFMYMMTGADAMHTFEVMKSKICFVGHSHIPSVFILRDGKLSQTFAKKITIKENSSYIVNVGSIGQPRDGDSRACYCIYDPEENKIEFRRVKYDIDTAADRIIKAGLPEILAERLFIGS